MRSQHLVRQLVVLVLVGSTAQAQPVPSRKAGPIDGWVIDANGPVAGAEVRTVSLSKVACVCKPKPDDTAAFGNEAPECACPEALAWYRQRLASCTWPLPAREVMRSDEQGHFSIDSAALGGMLEATTANGVQWLAAPLGVDRIGIELSAPMTRRLHVDTGAELHAALLFSDGHCMPFRREGNSNVWATVASEPAGGDEGPVLLVEANGFATVLRAWYESAPDLELALRPTSQVTGVCNGDRVEFDNPFQHLVVLGNEAKRFSFSGALDFHGKVRCLRRGKVIHKWWYWPQDGLHTAGGGHGGYSSPSYHDVQVVDRAGRPIAGAEVSYFFGTSGLRTGTTDDRGIAPMESVFAGGELVVHPPPDRGGWCAGKAKVAVTEQVLRKPIRVVLDFRRLHRSRWRGRLMSPEKLPIVGASVLAVDLQPAGHSYFCYEDPETDVETRPDGTFELPLLPNGKLKLYITHDWYAAREIEITLPSDEQEIELDRGLTWSGRVLDPDGNVIDQCQLSLTLSDDRVLTGACSATGFSFSTLVQGKAKVSVRVEKHPLGTWRELKQTIDIKPKNSFLEDVRWPGGATIAGLVVDASGAPIAGARLTALPQGTRKAVDRFTEGEVMLEADQDGRFVFRHLAPGTWTIRGGKQAKLDVETGNTNVKFVTSK